METDPRLTRVKKFKLGSLWLTSRYLVHPGREQNVTCASIYLKSVGLVVCLSTNKPTQEVSHKGGGDSQVSASECYESLLALSADLVKKKFPTQGDGNFRAPFYTRSQGQCYLGTWGQTTSQKCPKLAPSFLGPNSQCKAGLTLTAGWVFKLSEVSIFGTLTSIKGKPHLIYNLG